MNELWQTVDLQQLVSWSQMAGIKLAAAALTFVVGRWIAKLLVAALRSAMRRGHVDETLTSFVGNIGDGLLLAVVVISALSQLGVSTTSGVALLGGAGIAIGLSLKDQLSSFAAGVMLIIFRPFKAGDFVDAGGVMGTVEEIKIVATVMRSPNNQQITVPNAQVWGQTITNFSARETRRIDLAVGIAYDADMKKAKQIAMDLLRSDARVLAEPAPWVGITELGDSAVTVTIRPWVKTGDFWQTRCDLMEAIKQAFDANGIGIPFPQMDLHLKQDA